MQPCARMSLSEVNNGAIEETELSVGRTFMQSMIRIFAFFILLSYILLSPRSIFDSYFTCWFLFSGGFCPKTDFQFLPQTLWRDNLHANVAGAADINLNNTSTVDIYMYMGFQFYKILPVTNINIDNKMTLRKMTAIAVHFHEHFAAKPLRKFSGAE